MNETPQPVKRTTAPRRTAARRGIAGAVVLIIAAGAFLLWCLNRSPLAGERSHDFGIVRFDTAPKFVEHTFLLTNRTRDVLEIRAVRTTCGCTVARTTATSVQPGESFEVAVQFEFTNSGHRRKPLHVVLKDHRVVTLWIEGTGRETRQLSSVRDEVALSAQKPSYVSIFYLRFEGEQSPPPAPVIRAPAGVTSTLINWKLAVRGDASEGKPDQWSGQIKLEYDGSPLPDNAAVDVTAGRDQRLQVKLRIAEEAGSDTRQPAATSGATGDAASND